jgi:tetratricopeptide (TPR) repeat protein
LEESEIPNPKSKIGMGDSKKMKKLLFVSLFVFILQFGTFAQESQFAAGMKAAQGKDFETALEYFQKSVSTGLSNKKLAQIHYNIGVCLYQLKETRRSVAEFEQAVRLNPDYEKAFYALGMAHSDLQNWERAKDSFQRVLTLSRQQHGEAWFDLAFVFVRQENYDKAFTAFQKAIENGSRASGASHNNLGVIYILKGELEAGIKEIEKARALGFREAENNLAYIRQIVNSKDKIAAISLISRE